MAPRRRELGGQARQQRRFAGAGFADHGQDFAFVNVQLDIDAADARAVIVRQPLSPEQRGFGFAHRPASRRFSQ